jgi:transcriptional regulator with XRE-family HTH domain
MGIRKLPNFYARQLARDLTGLRVAAGFTQVEVALALEMSDKKVSRFETGQLPGYHELHDLLDLYGVPVCDWQPYLDAWKLANKKGWWHGLKLRDFSYVCNEHEATTIRDVQLTCLPVLLQTRDYADHLLRTVEPPHSRAQLAVELQARLRRQERLDTDHPVRLHALIYQPVLHGLSHAQLKLLLQRAGQANVTIQVIAQCDVPCGGLGGSFSLLSFPHKDEPDIAYTNDPLGLSQSDNPDRIASLRRNFRNLAHRALSPDASCAYIRRLIT